MTIQQMILGMPRLSFTFATSSTLDANSVWTPPAASTVGDLEILFHYGWDNDSEFLSATDIPAGVGLELLYTNTGSIDGSTANYLSIIVTRRILPDKNAITFNNPGLDGRQFHGIYFTPSRIIRSYDLSTVNFQSTAADPTAQVVTASAGISPLIVFGMASINNNNAAFNTATPAFDSTSLVDTGGFSSITGWKLYNFSPADHTIDKADQGLNMLGSFYLSAA